MFNTLPTNQQEADNDNFVEINIIVSKIFLILNNKNDRYSFGAFISNLATTRPITTR